MDCSRANTKDPDEWVEIAPEFSREMAAQLRNQILNWEPDLSESIKWNILCFSGRKLVCGINACKRHLGLTFFRGTELPDPAKLFNQGENNTSILSIRMTSLDDTPSSALRALLRAAVLLDAEPALPAPPRVKRPPTPPPDYLSKALKRNSAAARTFKNFAPTYQREYITWLTTAKRPETREQRLAQTLKALAAGKKWLDRKSA